jgi:hypothetical protein
LSEASFVHFPLESIFLREAEGRLAGSPFLWFLSFGETKERNSPAGARPGKPAKSKKIQTHTRHKLNDIRLK